MIDMKQCDQCVSQQILLNRRSNFTEWAKILLDCHFTRPTPSFYEESLAHFCSAYQ